MYCFSCGGIVLLTIICLGNNFCLCAFIEKAVVIYLYRYGGYTDYSEGKVFGFGAIYTRGKTLKVWIGFLPRINFVGNCSK